jgi:hypothetical protein
MNDIRSDSFMNLLSGLNTPGLDRTQSTFQQQPFYSNWNQQFRFTNYHLTNLYLNNGLAQKIVDRPADDSFQRGVEIEEDEEELMANEYDRLQVLTRMADVIRWARLYGGAVLLLIAKDGGDLIDPLNLNNIDSIEEIRVYDLTCVHATDIIYNNIIDPTTFGKIEVYTIAPQNMAAFQVHESRLIPVGGDPLPAGILNYNRIPWAGRSILDAVYVDISRYLQGLDWALRLLERKQQGVYQMEGLGNMFAQGDDHLVQKRINLVDLVRGNLNSVVVDKTDSYTVMNASMEGVQAMLDEFQTALAASSSIPITILFGKSTRGLNQTGSGDLESYYGVISHIQNVIARPALEKLTSILWTQSALRGKAPEDWHIEFNPLWLPTELEQAQTDFAKQQANTAEVTALVSLLTNQILTPEEVRTIVVNKYSEFDFDTDMPVFGDDVGYANDVDTSLMDAPGVAQKTANQKPTNKNQKPTNNATQTKTN